MNPMYRLVVRSGPSLGKTFPLDKPELVIGRDASADIVINDPEMSRRHARVYLQGSYYIIEDLGSTNGTSINGQRLMGPYSLQPGVVITFGEHVSLAFETIGGDVNATVVSGGRAPATVVAQQPAYAPPPAPAYAPPPAPAYPPPQPAYPPPQPAFAQQMPPPYAPAEGGETKKFPTWVILLIVLGILVFCGLLIGGFLWYVDANSLWCNFFGFLFAAC